MQGSYTHVEMPFPVAVVVLVCAVVVGDEVVDLIVLVVDVVGAMVAVLGAGSPAASTQYE